MIECGETFYGRQAALKALLVALADNYKWLTEIVKR